MLTPEEISRLGACVAWRWDPFLLRVRACAKPVSTGWAPTFECPLCGSCTKSGLGHTDLGLEGHLGLRRPFMHEIYTPRDGGGWVRREFVEMCSAPYGNSPCPGTDEWYPQFARRRLNYIRALQVAVRRYSRKEPFGVWLYCVQLRPDILKVGQTKNALLRYVEDKYPAGNLVRAAIAPPGVGDKALITALKEDGAKVVINKEYFYAFEPVSFDAAVQKIGTRLVFAP